MKDPFGSSLEPKPLTSEEQLQLLRLGQKLADALPPGQPINWTFRLNSGATLVVKGPPRCTRCLGTGEEPTPEIGD